MNITEAVKTIVENIAADNDGKHWDFIVSGYAGKQMVAYQSMREDLSICIDAANKLQTAKLDGTITTSLFYTIIILYGKCFADATKAKYPKLEIKDCFKATDSRLLDTHKILIDARNTLVAHRGDSVNDVGVAYLKIQTENGSRQFRVRQRRQRKPNNQDLIKYIELFKHLINVVEIKFEKAGIKVWGHMTKDFTPKQFAQLRFAGPDKPTLIKD
ncbi:MAG: hypothetical protein JNL53_19805 [Cyclobacteriaceae bacterium]|nr:hypothetical protein [Cyclobacteriaceae bacterium]